MDEINEYLAYKPWDINVKHIINLTSSQEAHKLTWSIPEILEAASILAHYHSLCGLVYGQGLIGDSDIAMSFDKTSSLNKVNLEYSTKTLSDFNYTSE